MGKKKEDYTLRAMEATRKAEKRYKGQSLAIDVQTLRVVARSFTSEGLRDKIQVLKKKRERILIYAGGPHPQKQLLTHGGGIDWDSMVTTKDKL